MAGYRVALVKWEDSPGMANAIALELEALGHRPCIFRFDRPLPADVDIVLTFAPYDRLWQIGQQISPTTGPRWIHWNTEGFPDLRLPWRLMLPLSVMRSAVDYGELLRWRLSRFRYLGDYWRLLRQGRLTLLGEISAVYCNWLNRNGVPAHFAPFGSSPMWQGAYDLERDIDVLWIGARATRRRSRILDGVRARLAEAGVAVYVVDNVERPFVFGEARTRLFNRAKITLNVTRTWYDDNTLRFCMAMPNRSLIVSEQLLPHSPAYKAGVHYVAAPASQLAATVLHWLAAERAREQMVERAYKLSSKLTMGASVAKLIGLLDRDRASGRQRKEARVAGL